MRNSVLEGRDRKLDDIQLASYSIFKVSDVMREIQSRARMIREVGYHQHRVNWWFAEE